MKWIISLMALNTIYMLLTPKLYAHVSFLNSKLIYPTAHSTFSSECLMHISRSKTSKVELFFLLLMYLFWDVLGLSRWALLQLWRTGLVQLWCMGSSVVAFLLQSIGSRVYGPQQLQHMGSAVVAPGLQSTGSITGPGPQLL